MIQNYLTIALRHFSRGKLYTFINISGLSIGIACTLLIVLFINDDLSFDKFHVNGAQVYRIGEEILKGDGTLEAGVGASSPLLGPLVHAHIPGIKSFARIHSGYEDIRIGDRVQALSIMQADTSFFSIFSFPILTGKASTALSHANNIVLTETTSVKLFGSGDVIGKTIEIKRDEKMVPFLVAAIAKDCPQNSSIQFEAVIPNNVPDAVLNDPLSWMSFGANTFLLLDPRVNTADMELKIQSLQKEESKEAMERVRSWGFETQFVPKLQRLEDIHLATVFRADGGGVDRASHPTYSRILAAIAAFIILIACINFVNLSVARSIKRTKEIGIRKVIGGARKQLIWQFLGESSLLCIASFAAGLALAATLLPTFNAMINKELSISYLFGIESVVICVILFVIIVILAGAYPALIVSSYDPVKILHHRFRLAGKNYLQHSLVVVQFSIAGLLMLGTTILFQQFEYITSFDLGYDYHNVILARKKNLTSSDVRALRAELQGNEDFESVSVNGGWGRDGKINGDSSIFFFFDCIDANYFALFKIPILEGRNFEENSPYDSSSSIIVNEAFVKRAGWKDPIGQEIHVAPYDGNPRKVVGVVPDYYNVDLTIPKGPQVFVPTPVSPYNSFLARIRPGSEARSQAALEAALRKLFPLNPVETQFMDDSIKQRYQAEQRWKTTLLFASIVTIAISCFGLIGLSLLTAEKRFKEIGLRKVLGASISSVMLTLGRSFVTLVIVSFIIAMPIAFYAGGLYLERYPYRIELGPGIFIVCGAAMLIIAVVTVSLQAFKAASANPVDALKAD